MTRRSAPSVRGYLVALVAAFAVVALLLVWFSRRQGLEDARQAATERVDFVAGLAADEIDLALDGQLSTIGSLAANPALAGHREPIAGCTLAANEVGPFTANRIDVVA